MTTGRGNHKELGKITPEHRLQLKGRAYQLRLEGWTFRQIAAELRVTYQTAHNWVQEVRKDTIFEPAEDVFRNEIERLDMLQREAQDNLNAIKLTLKKEFEEYGMYGQKTLELHQKAQASLLRVSESRRKFMGLDAADRLEVTNKSEPTEAEKALKKMLWEHRNRNQDRLREMRGENGETEHQREAGSS